MPAQGAAPNIRTEVLPSPNQLSVVQVALTPAIVATITTAVQTFTVTGLSLGDSLQAADQILSVRKAAHQAGLGITSARVSAADTVEITFINPTAAGITPTAGELYTFVVFRPYALAAANATVV